MVTIFVCRFDFLSFQKSLKVHMSEVVFIIRWQRVSIFPFTENLNLSCCLSRESSQSRCGVSIGKSPISHGWRSAVISSTAIQHVSHHDISDLRLTPPYCGLELFIDVDFTPSALHNGDFVFSAKKSNKALIWQLLPSHNNLPQAFLI